MCNNTNDDNNGAGDGLMHPNVENRFSIFKRKLQFVLTKRQKQQETS